MILKMTAGLADEDKFDLKQENMMEFKDDLEEAVNTFCHGNVVCAIPINYDTKETVTRTANLLTEPNSCPLEVVTDFAQQVWRNANEDFRIDKTETNAIALD